MQVNHSFKVLEFKNEMPFHFDDRYTVTLLTGEDEMSNVYGSSFVYVHSGSVVANNRFHLSKGMYGVVTEGGLAGYSLCTRALVIRDRNYHAMSMFGGPIERRGRLRYIDGCTDSLLVPPVKLGDPCLNHLHFPKGIKQTMHTHPSARVGIVTKGSGLCHTPFGTVPMLRGMVFMIMPENGYTAFGEDGMIHRVGLHCFETTDDEMDIVAFHPNSDWGPTDEEHPMLAQTHLVGALQ
jgi:hypothetical protein